MQLLPIPSKNKSFAMNWRLIMRRSTTREHSFSYASPFPGSFFFLTSTQPMPHDTAKLTAELAMTM